MDKMLKQVIEMLDCIVGGRDIRADTLDAELRSR